MKTLFYIVLIGASLACTGCQTSAPTTANKAMQSVSVSVEVALGAWDQWVKAGKATVAQEQSVEQAYEKYQAAFAVMCDAGAVWQASLTTTNTLSASNAYVYAAQNVSTELTSVVNLIHSFGVNF